MPRAYPAEFRARAIALVRAGKEPEADRRRPRHPSGHVVQQRLHHPLHGADAPGPACPAPRRQAHRPALRSRPASRAEGRQDRGRRLPARPVDRWSGGRPGPRPGHGRRHQVRPGGARQGAVRAEGRGDRPDGGREPPKAFKLRGEWQAAADRLDSLEGRLAGLENGSCMCRTTGTSTTRWRNVLRGSELAEGAPGSSRRSRSSTSRPRWPWAVWRPSRSTTRAGPGATRCSSTWAAAWWPWVPVSVSRPRSRWTGWSPRPRMAARSSSARGNRRRQAAPRALERGLGRPRRGRGHAVRHRPLRGPGVAHGRRYGDWHRPLDRRQVQGAVAQDLLMLVGTT